MVPEDDIALVGEVTKVGAAGDSGPFGDLGDRRLFEPSLGEELDRRPRNAFARPGLPTTHAESLGDVTQCHRVVV